jgi:DNA-binding transcriptional MocR family regulator
MQPRALPLSCRSPALSDPQFPVTPRPHRYRALATALADELRAGRHPPGAQLPSVRQLCVEHGASLATVTHALHDLEDAGLIEARPRLGCHFDAEDIIITQGEGESLELCLRLLTKPGDLIAVASPAPLRALEIIASMGLRVLEIPASTEAGLSVPALAFALQQHPVAACLVEPSFHRVNGSLLNDAAKQQLTALLAQHQLPLIECDMMGELYRGAHRPRPLKAFDGDDRVLYCGSFACITGPGFSVGYVVSGRHRLQLRAARAVHGELMASLTDTVLADFMASGSFEPHLRRLRQRLAGQVAAYRDAVLAQFPPDTRVSIGEGGYALWLELPGGLDACTLLEQARRKGYTFVPGAVFSMGTQWDHCLRLTAGHPLDEARAQGIRTLGELARRLLANGPWVESPVSASPAA